ncbi:hypothetical protein FRC17_003219, partial [Serendipita sp. 399]
MSVDLSDSNIQTAYASVVRGEALSWLILTYGQTRDTLSLLSTGTGGIEELQRTLAEDDAYFAFAPRAANGLPPIRSSQATVLESSTPRAQSPASVGNSRNNSRLPVYSVTRSSDNAPTPSKTPLLSKKVPTQDKRDAPLPPPPPAGEDSEEYEIVNAPIITANAIAARLRGPSMAMSDIQSQYSVDTHPVPDLPQSYAASSYRASSEIDFTGGGTPTSKPLFLTEAQEQAALSRAKWAEEEAGLIRSRRGRTKSDIQRERELEEIEMARAAAEAAARRKYEKEQQLLKEAEEEERKKAEFAEAQRRRAAERLRREQQRREEEEREQRAAEERKRVAHERRLEEARRAETRRLEELRRQEEKDRKEKEKKETQAAEREARMKEIQRRFDNLRLTAGVLLTGYVSIQPGTSIVWRRRYFQLQSDYMLFFKNAEETHKIVDSFELQGYVTGVKEWNQGYDDLRAIPHSFAVEFIDQPSWLFFADSEEDKDIL